jgi:hypothetical protein
MQFAAESVGVNEKGEVIVAKNAASPPKRTRRTKEAIANDEAEKLQAVFKVLAEKKLSLSEFLCASFKSSEELVKTKIGQFYATNGPARILRLWGGELEDTDNDRSLVEAAIEIVGERVQTDLVKTTSDKSLRHPANSISRKSIKGFSLDRLRHSFKQSAPYLTLLLETMIPREKPKPGSVAGWKPRDMGKTEKKQSDKLKAKKDRQPPTRGRTPSDSEMETLSLPFPQSGIAMTLPPGPDSASEMDSASDCDTNLEPVHELLSRRPELALTVEQLMEYDAEWEEELDPHPEADPRCFIVVVASILAFMKSQQTNCLQMMIGKIGT